MKKLWIMIFAVIMSVSLCACGGSESNSGSNQNAGSEATQNLTEQKIEITTENWSEYFELRVVVTANKDAFDEYSSADIVESLYLKDEVKDKVKSIEDIALEFKTTNVKGYTIEYNPETGELKMEISDVETEKRIPDIIGRFTPEERTEILEYVPDSLTYLYDFEYEYSEDNVLRGSALLYTDKECTRAKGTLIILE